MSSRVHVRSADESDLPRWKSEAVATPVIEGALVSYLPSPADEAFPEPIELSWSKLFQEPSAAVNASIVSHVPRRGPQSASPRRATQVQLYRDIRSEDAVRRASGFIRESESYLVTSLRERFDEAIDRLIGCMVAEDDSRSARRRAVFVLYQDGLLTKGEVINREELGPGQFFEELREHRLRRANR